MLHSEIVRIKNEENKISIFVYRSGLQFSVHRSINDHSDQCLPQLYSSSKYFSE